MAPTDTLAAPARPGRPLHHPLAVLAAATVAVAVLGIPGGFLWSAIAPRVAVVVTGHGSAEVVNPETSAFIAADGWFCVLGFIGGVAVGVAGYRIAVRRHGAVAVLGLMAGGLAASLVEWWIGRNIGLAAFRSSLLVSRTGVVLHAPLMLRAHDALVIWPLSCALAVGAAELLAGRQHRTGRGLPARGDPSPPPL